MTHTLLHQQWHRLGFSTVGKEKQGFCLPYCISEVQEHFNFQKKCTAFQGSKFLMGLLNIIPLECFYFHLLSAVFLPSNVKLFWEKMAFSPPDLKFWEVFFASKVACWDCKFKLLPYLMAFFGSRAAPQRPVTYFIPGNVSSICTMYASCEKNGPLLCATSSNER